MADKRMLSKKITDHDNFTSLPASAQALYMHLCLSADDDGFCSQVNTAVFKAHAKKKDLEMLLSKKYLLRFDNDVIVIKHWRMMNSIRKDRYAPTVYQEELDCLTERDDGAYTMATICQPNDNQCLPQVRLGKDSIGKYRLDKNSLEEDIPGI